MHCTPVRVARRRRAPGACVALRVLAPLACVVVLTACGNDGSLNDSGPGGPVPTATPYARPPTPLILTPRSGAGVATAQEITYTVEPGDTLFAIAGRYDTTVEAIVRRNNLPSVAEIKIGQELLIPVGPQTRAAPTASPAPTQRAAPPPTATAPTTAATSTPARTPTAPPGGRVYVVQSGDTAGAIADRFGVSLADLAAANARTVASLTDLRVDERLVIPAPR
ncbi:MAG: LysM peptidoglycan-binding domain-containing protein [Chloroflexi bacterium]|nr:LysM peptidoglycan-binding domain-containing protein [Chloroflexota bacterium]